MKQYLTAKEFSHIIANEIKILGSIAKVACAYGIKRVTLVSAIRRNQYSSTLANKFGYKKEEVYFKKVK